MARRRYELTDREWAIIEPLLPNKPRGVARVDDRRVLKSLENEDGGLIIMHNLKTAKSSFSLLQPNRCFWSG